MKVSKCQDLRKIYVRNEQKFGVHTQVDWKELLSIIPTKGLHIDTLNALLKASLNPTFLTV